MQPIQLHGITSGIVDIGDALLAVDEAGAGAPVVCLAGLDGRAAWWQKQVDALVATRRAITFDARGVGRSSHSQIRYSVGQMAEDLVSMLDALGLETATLLGHGLGSVVALQTAIQHRDRVDKLVLGAPWAEPTAFETEQTRLQQAILRGCGAEAYAVHEVMRSAPAAWLRARPWLIRERAAQRVAALSSVEVELSRLRAAAECNVLPRLPHLRVPTLVIADTHDQMVPHNASRQVALALPHARFELLSGGGHWHPEVLAERYSESLLGFLDE